MNVEEEMIWLRLMVQILREQATIDTRQVPA
jgi:hypothetical protein